MTSPNCPKPPRYTATKTYETEDTRDEYGGAVTGVIDRELLEIAIFGQPGSYSDAQVERWTDGLNAGTGDYGDRDRLVWTEMEVQKRWYMSEFQLPGRVVYGIVDRETNKIAHFGDAEFADRAYAEERMGRLYSGKENVDNFSWTDLAKGELVTA